MSSVPAKNTCCSVLIFIFPVIIRPPFLSLPPGGKITLLFAGDGEIALTVETLDATLLDSDYIWNTRHTPSHERRKR